jgi:SDR family mycofactocin-dependent oxidoreductase
MMEESMGRVDGKVVLITGAARGQGRSHAVRLAEEGADIIGFDICKDIETVGYTLGTSEELQETANLVEKAGRRAFVREVDVRDRAAMDVAIAEAVAEFGRLDVVVANAAVGTVGPGPVTAFADVVDVNLVGVFNTVHAALPHTGEGASFILIGSSAAFFSAPGEPGGMSLMGPGGIGYPFAKRMLATYIDWFAPFLAPSGRRINVVQPTNVDTPMLHNQPMYRIFRQDLQQPTFDDVEESFQDLHGMPIPYVEAIDISHAVTYLASEESRYVTGIQLRVDGGAVVKAGKTRV